jgi:hypothetical protein
MNTSTGIFNSMDKAENAIIEINKLGVSDKDISYIYMDKDSKMVEGTPPSNNTVGENISTGATTGLVIGAVAGLVVATGILPGLGALFVAGPLATALGLSGAAAATVSGALTGAAAGGLIGALVGLGVNEADAKLYEEELKKGGILVVARSEQSNVSEIFERFGALEVREYSSEN